MKSSAVVVAGYVIDAPEWGRLRSWSDGAVVMVDGRIAAVGPATEVRLAWPEARWHDFGPGVQPVILPGLIDVHVHVPQYPVVARVEDELLPWLERHIFPIEQNFRAGCRPVRDEVEAFFGALAAHGTTTAMVYAAGWRDSCQVAFEAAERSGLRILMGTVLMDVGPHGPWAGLPSSDRRRRVLAEAEALASEWHGRDAGRLEYVFSPRFALTCSMELMREAAALAAARGCALQTHLSENTAEVAAVAAQFPQAVDYTDVYDRAGMLGPRTVLGHCLHLSDREIVTLAAAGAAVAHCPTSNLFLHSGLCPLDRLRAAGLRIGLGSDVAAGPELNMWQVMRSAVETQTARAWFEKNVPRLTPAQAFFMATQGGAEVVGLGRTVGTLEPGRDADLLVLDLNRLRPGPATATPPYGHLTAGEIIALSLYRGGPTAVLETRVRGHIVWPRLPDAPGSSLFSSDGGF